MCAEFKITVMSQKYFYAIFYTSQLWKLIFIFLNQEIMKFKYNLQYYFRYTILPSHVFPRLQFFLVRYSGFSI